MSKLKFIDLFAGIGGLSLPFRELGMECVFSSEIDKFAVQTYIENFNEIPFGDIREISEESIPNHDLLLGGFPCQAFSIAGKRKGFNDDRGNLFYEIVRILSFHKPKAFLLENVKGLMNHEKGNTFRTILNNLTDLGYKVTYKILNARNFGLPQNRERVYIVGFLEHSIDFQFPTSFNKPTAVSDIIENNIDKKYTISDKLWNSHQERKERNRSKGNGFGYSLVYKNSEYTSTLSARYYKDGSEILLYQENNNPRKLTPRECANLQGFPSNFKIIVSDNQSYKQFGNSVAVAVVREIAKEIVKLLERVKF
ncbi:DNA cytosine methyltransferase [Spiroplasma endosymbiont of Amphimallon solstitiale]|uniref:DNA cytosine methyltransferase n=1 Tax=Spiroplasma endosymbiont of Amphimallon solstitiale TaxID=3066288 RepID=UPI00313BD414